MGQFSHVSQPLSNFAVELFREQATVANRIAPVIPVSNDSDTYYTFDNREQISQDIDLTRGNGEIAKIIQTDASTATYTCIEYAAAAMITDRDRANTDDIVQLEQREIGALMAKHRLALESRLKTIYFTSGNWSNTSTPSNKWDVATTDIVGDFDTAIETVLKEIGTPANTMILNLSVWNKIKSHPDLTELQKYTNDLLAGGGVAQNATLNGLQIIIPDFVQNTANPGQTQSNGFVWSDEYAWIGYVNPNPGIRDVTAAVQFQSQAPQVVEWRNEERSADMYRAEMRNDEVVVASGAGYLYTSVLT